MEKTIETKIIEIDKFPNTAFAHEEVYIYRRLEDIYDPTAIAVLNTKREVVGYLDRNVAQTQILPKIKEGVKFRCFVTGPPDEEGIPISITEGEYVESEPAHPILNPLQIKFTDEEDVDDELGKLEDEEELEYPDLDNLKIDTDENDDDWN
ncbi:TPA: hypothetical protein EYP66_07370 [Candidatus Poribacteria bacterium]|nr:hypothetical protein [Candidatus Poribacteria bacterium]